MSIQRKKTEKVELVETGNILLSLNRMWDMQGTQHVRRALYHAWLMSHAGRADLASARRLREALELP